MAVCLLYPDADALDEELRVGLSRLSAALISDQMERSNGLRRILPVTPLTGPVAGRAFTVKSQPGDNLVIHQAAEFVRPGDFLIIDAGGDLDRAVIGELWCGYVKSKGAVGVAVDGAARDQEAVARLGMPVFARAITHLGPYKTGSGEIRGPVAVGGTVVHTGDYVVGDSDGVVVVPRERAAQVLAMANARQATEARMLADITAGRLDRSWLSAAVTLVPAVPGPPAAAGRSAG